MIRKKIWIKVNLIGVGGIFGKHFIEHHKHISSFFIGRINNAKQYNTK